MHATTGKMFPRVTLYLVQLLFLSVMCRVLPMAILASGSSMVNSQTTSCESLSCENGGTCVQESNGGYSCTCPLGYKGAKCGEVWLTEEAFMKLEDKLKTLSAIVGATQYVQLTQHREMQTLSKSQDQSKDLLKALNGPRFFISWTSLQAAEGIVDTSYLQIDNKQMLAVLTTSSLVRVFELRNQSIFVEVQILPSRQAWSLKGFSLRENVCLAVAQSSQALRSNREHEAKSVLYCWNATLKSFEKLQDIATRGAVHVEFVSIGNTFKFLVFSSSRYQGQTSTQTSVYVWSAGRQRFLLYQYLPIVGAVHSSAVSTEDSTFLSVHQVNGSTGSGTKLFAWNGTHFHHVQTVSSRSSYIFAAGRCMFMISSGIIYRHDMDSKNFSFHSTLQGPQDSRDLYEYFTASNEHFIAVGHFEGNESVAIYRLNGFDFVPYQKISVPSNLSSIKVFGVQEGKLLLAIMGRNKIELLEWKHI